MQHSELYQFAVRFWWLIFPILGMGMGLANTVLRHHRARQALEVIQTYIANGREPPPEILKLAQNSRPQRASGDFLWIPVCVMTAVTIGLLFLAGRDADNDGLYFAAIVTGGVAIGFLVTAMRKALRPAPPAADLPPQ